MKEVFADGAACVGRQLQRLSLTEADFSGAVNYDIDVFDNTITGATFTRGEAARLLNSLGIRLVD